MPVGHPGGDVAQAGGWIYKSGLQERLGLET